MQPAAEPTFTEAEQLEGVPRTSSPEIKHMAEQALGRRITLVELKAIQEAHKVGEGHAYEYDAKTDTYSPHSDPELRYTQEEIAKKARILAEVKTITPEERRKLMEQGVVGESE